MCIEVCDEHVLYVMLRVNGMRRDLFCRCGKIGRLV